jgi:dihydrofolate reductase
MKLGLIFARARNGVIGKDGGLPWHLPEDLARFKQLTVGCPVIMGRKTWDSLPARFRPLPGRTNIVVTRSKDWSGEGATRAGSLEEATALCGGNRHVWVIGGADIYAQAMALADLAEVTVIDADYEGDAFAPELGPGWRETARTRHASASGLKFDFVSYENTRRGARTDTGR